MSLVLSGSSGVTTNSGTLISATTIGVGGTTPSASGAGVSFPATQSASTDANTLDDYEEGTWTIGSTGTGTAATTGWYTKIGRQVTCWGAIYQQDASGPTTFTGLPFSSNAMDSNNNAGGFCLTQSGSTAGTFIGVKVTNSSTQYQLIKGFSAYAPVNGEVDKFVIVYFV
jgi:hypothetical protein